MDLRAKLTILADAAKYDASCASSGSTRPRPEHGIGNGAPVGICHSYTPDGRCVSLLKILLTNYCIYDCTYCVNRVSSDTPRARFTPEEVVRLTIQFYKRNYIEGLFLSSGVAVNPNSTMEQLVRVAKLLRTEEQFGGYIHLKAVPGAAPELLRAAAIWADRLSANIELPTQMDLDRLAPAKSHSEIESAMSEISAAIAETKESTSAKAREPSFAATGQSTQMIVGATDTSDARILQTASALYRRYGLRRVYYSGFSPIPHSDPRLPPDRVPLIREHRLYQADWLTRYYGFRADELTTAAEPNLSLERDPKLMWALRHRHFFPVNVNTASKQELLRVPGFGVRNVGRMLSARRYRALTLDDLSRLRVPISKSKYFIVTAERPLAPVAHLDSMLLPGRFQQPSLFETGTAARTGEL
jgi:putative DNA modification/repair radical SAM protein